MTCVKGSIALFGVHLYYNEPINIILDPLEKRPSLSVDRICSVVHRGVSHDGRFVGGVCVIRNQTVTQGTKTAI